MGDMDGTDASNAFMTFPGSSTALHVHGSVTVSMEDANALRLVFSLHGLERDATGGLHIHAGTSCATEEDVGGHFWAPVSSDDPWSVDKGTKYISDSTGASTGVLVVDCGYKLDDVAGPLAQAGALLAVALLWRAHRVAGLVADPLLHACGRAYL